MIATVFQDLFISLLVGVLFAWSGREEIRNEPGGPTATGAFRRAIIFQVCVWTPCALYFMIAYPSWSWWYYISEQELNWGLRYMPVLVELIVMIGGFALVGALVRANALLAAQAVIALSVLLMLLLIVGPWERVHIIGSYAEYHSGMGTHILLRLRTYIEFPLIGVLFLYGFWSVWSRNRQVGRLSGM